jgi:hypothetical protein
MEVRKGKVPSFEGGIKVVFYIIINVIILPTAVPSHPQAL